MASMKITFFDICDTNWTQMVDPKDTNMELNRILIFPAIKNTETILLPIIRRQEQLTKAKAWKIIFYSHL